MHIPTLSIVPEDKANHFLRGSQVASVSATLVMLVTAIVLVLLNAPHAVAVFFAGAAAAVISARLAGELVEADQRKQNEAADARGEPLPHNIEQADIIYTARGGFPVALPLIALGVMAALLPAAR